FEKYEDCIVVEDALNGIVAAKAAGMKCIAVSTSFSAAELSKEEPDWICGNVYEIKELIARF
ncbi:MAG: HAD hydrolase-like protein, partial [Vallitaleaceae bacterium]|nr:HAD hydrolase-like protein [Vallitaleaceae bacterium]